jgi:uncharacterized membrane protein YphA (DoxX/SURF4 family)
MDEPKFSSGSEPRNLIGYWVIRVGVAAVFVIFGAEKFSDDASSHWVRLFHEIGWGDRFRYFTGVVEVLGGLLVLIPRTALIGVALLIMTMAGAVIIVACVLGRHADSVFPAVLLVALIGIAFWVWKNR